MHVKPTYNRFMPRKFLIAALVLFAMILLPKGGRAFAQAPTPQAPTPATTPAPNPPPSQVTVTNRFLFDSSTLSSAVERSIAKQLEKSQSAITAELARGQQLLQSVSGENAILVDYTDIAKKYFPIAAAIAPLFFVLRLVIYQWNRLGGEDDSIATVGMDYLTAIAFALLIGPTANLIHRFIYWAVGTFGLQALATDVASTFSGDFWTTFGNSLSNGLFAVVVGFGLAVAAMIAFAAFLVGFLSAFVILYIVSAIGPIVSIVACIPQLRWVRSTLIKTTALILLLPLLGILVIRAVTILPQGLGGGIFGGLVRTIFMLGAASVMLSAAGLIGKFTWGSVAAGAARTLKAAGVIAATALTGGSAAGLAATTTTASTASTTTSFAASTTSASTTAAATTASTPSPLPPYPTGWQRQQLITTALGQLTGIPPSSFPHPPQSLSPIRQYARNIAAQFKLERGGEEALAGLLERAPDPNQHPALAQNFVRFYEHAQQNHTVKAFLEGVREYPYHFQDLFLTSSTTPVEEVIRTISKDHPLYPIFYLPDQNEPPEPPPYHIHNAPPPSPNEV